MAPDSERLCHPTRVCSRGPGGQGHSRSGWLLAQRGRPPESRGHDSPGAQGVQVAASHTPQLGVSPRGAPWRPGLGRRRRRELSQQAPALSQFIHCTRSPSAGRPSHPHTRNTHVETCVHMLHMCVRACAHCMCASTHARTQRDMCARMPGPTVCRPRRSASEDRPPTSHRYCCALKT